MQSLKSVRKGSKVKPLLCYACLTSDRKLFVLNKSAADYKRIWRKIVESKTLKNVSLCWECLALLRNVRNFQEKVKLSQTMLKEIRGDQKCLLKKLSNLSTTQPTTTDSTLGLVTQVNLNNEHKMEFFIEAVKTEIDIIDSELELDRIDNLDSDIKRVSEIIDSELDLAKFKSLDNSIKTEIETTQAYDEISNELEDMKEDSPPENIKEDLANTIEVPIQFLDDLNAVKPKRNDKDLFPVKVTDGNEKKRRKTKKDTGKGTYYKVEHVRVGQEDNYRKHGEFGKFICDYCEKKFRQKRFIENHIFRLHIRQVCSVCNLSFVHVKSLRAHTKLKHRVDRSEATYCVQCDKQFDNIWHFRKHFQSYKVHAGERPKKKSESFTCPVCGNVYAKKLYMKNHYDKEHTEVPRFQCADCGKSFLTNAKLKRHSMYVHQEFVRKRDKICAYCGRGFPDTAVLKNHIRTHTGERPYKCPHCESSFGKKTVMLKHIQNKHTKKEHRLKK